MCGVERRLAVGIDRRRHAADEEALQVRVLPAEHRVHLDELALPVERFEVVRHGHQVRFGRQPVSGVAPVGVGERPELAAIDEPLSRSRTPAKYFGLDSGQSEIDSASADVFRDRPRAPTMSTQSSACRW